MKKTDENLAWLNAEPADELRKIYQAQAKLSVDALMSAARDSTDPKVRGHLMAYLAWQAAYKELVTVNESD